MLRRRVLCLSLGLLSLMGTLGLGCGESDTNQREQMAHVQLEMVCESLRAFGKRQGRLPETELGLNEVVQAGLVDAVYLKDSWGRQLQYEIVDPPDIARLRFQGRKAPEVVYECDAMD